MSDGVILGLAVAWAVFMMLGAWIAGQKGRSSGEGLVPALLLGILGLLIELLLPNKPQPTPPVPPITPAVAPPPGPRRPWVGVERHREHGQRGSEGQR